MKKHYIPPSLELLKVKFPRDILLVSIPKESDYTTPTDGPGYDEIIDDGF